MSGDDELHDVWPEPLDKVLSDAGIPRDPEGERRRGEANREHLFGGATPMIGHDGKGVVTRAGTTDSACEPRGEGCGDAVTVAARGVVWALSDSPMDGAHLDDRHVRSIVAAIERLEAALRAGSSGQGAGEG